jgi:DMSO reductase family type II enzyme heme b subunit
MLVKKVSTPRDVLLDPEASQWKSAAAVTMALRATPLKLQPSGYVKAAFKNRPFGRTKKVSVGAVHNGEEVFFHLTWTDPNDDRTIQGSNVFPDAAALLFPINSDAPIISMGSKTQPVNAWYWRADFGESGKNNVAEGLGTTRQTAVSHVACRAAWKSGTRRLVFARPLAVPDQAGEAVQLRAGGTTRFGVAVWEGANGERAGIKAFSEAWKDLQLEA